MNWEMKGIPTDAWSRSSLFLTPMRRIHRWRPSRGLKGAIEVIGEGSDFLTVVLYIEQHGEGRMLSAVRRSGCTLSVQEPDVTVP